MKRCMTGPSLSTNSVLSIAKARKNTSDFRPSMPAATPLSSVVRISGAAFCAPSVALLRVVDAEVAQPALDLVQ